MRGRRRLAALALASLYALSCGQVVQELGDGAGGSVSGSVSASPSDAPTPTGGTKPNPTAPGDTPETTPCFEDGARCPQGYGCLLPWTEDGAAPALPGVCAPICSGRNSPELGQPCAPDATGALGVCRPFTHDSQTPLAYLSICTSDCDPLAPVCPPRYSCEATAARLGAFVFSCLPVTRREPLLEGQLCDGMPQGQCSPGLACVSRGSFAQCSRFCDLQDPGACPSPAMCVLPRDFPDGTVGICSLPD